MLEKNEETMGVGSIRMKVAWSYICLNYLQNRFHISLVREMHWRDIAMFLIVGSDSVGQQLKMIWYVSLIAFEKNNHIISMRQSLIQ